ncbi:hypothetical protein TWF694_009132 [Orbilia ellipsospora]|uniref:Vacuolar protein sorting-associated protein 51 homolog n=1 Tax=Orbilia ellipsospora TaxID=2528407 RepID=A0AAV9XEJ2_9PEZI
MTSTPTIAINSPPGSSRPSIDSSVAHSRLSSESIHSLASLPSHASTPIAGNSIRTHGAASQRRNRSALREFYGINARRDAESPAASASHSPAPPASHVPDTAGGGGGAGLGVTLNDTNNATITNLLPASELDGADFNAGKCVERLLETQGLQTLLRVENGLVNDIRGLDGERKSLVYDNYNKLIAATDTIRSMRSNMEPMSPTTTTLLPAISHIASLSASLVENVHAHDEASTAQGKLKRKQDGVRYILNTPDRLKVLIDGGKREEAMREWGVVRGYVEKWKGDEEGVRKFLERGEGVLAGR